VPAGCRTNAAGGADADNDRIRRAADELLKRGRDATGMTEATARHRQLELALLLHTVARAFEAGDRLPHELLRHVANLSRPILNYPARHSASAARYPPQADRFPLRSAGRCLEQDAYKPSRISSAHW